MLRPKTVGPRKALKAVAVPQSLLAWQRVRLASAMAHSGEEWWTTFKRSASGTYVNQYMIVDFKLFQPGHALKPGTLWVVEEIVDVVLIVVEVMNCSRSRCPCR